MFARFLSLTALLGGATAVALGDVILPPIFSDHMVLQRSASTPVWGKASQGEHVKVVVAAVQAEAVAGADGRWRLQLDLTKIAAGPHRLDIQGNNTLSVSDVLVGEVWLASGQSNMEHTLSNFKATEEIATSTDDQLRFFQVSFKAVAVPQADVYGCWELASPKTSPAFSATAWFFARKLRRELGTPVAILSSSVGGTPIEAWTSLDALESVPSIGERARADLADSRDFSKKQTVWCANMKAWAHHNRRDDPPTPKAQLVEFVSGTPASGSGWNSVRLPGVVPGNGIQWVKREVKVADGDVARELVLDINEIVGIETVYWDGQAVGGRTLDNYPGDGAGRNGVRRQYRVSAAQVTAGMHTVAIRIYAPWGEAALNGGYFSAGSQYMGGEWKMKTEIAFSALSPEAESSWPVTLQAPLRPGNLPSSLYNGMIAGLAPYGLRGMIWYQGEHNTGRPELYRDNFPLLIKDWRSRWGAPELPFYWCQLPNYGSKTNMPDAVNGWVSLRDAQSRTLSLPHTGQAVIIDVGEASDIHPANKRDPGERLAAIALVKDYGREGEYSGPVCVGEATDGNAVRLQFAHIGGGLEARPVPAEYLDSTHPKRVTKPITRNSPDSQLEGFAIRGADGLWFWAEAHIEGGDVLVSSPRVKVPVAVRYAWSGNPTCNLYNRAGFPAGPFELTFVP